MPELTINFSCCFFCVLYKVAYKFKKSFCENCLKSIETTRQKAFDFIKEQCENEN